MNTSLTAYTHLESLLLFQSLHAYGVAPPVFSRISELLKNNLHINSDRRFQSGRLSPDALRNFYLHILKEEIRSERQEGASHPATPNGDGKSSRKRKAASPMPTIQEAAQHTHLIPKLVARLYARYRSAITEQIRDEEDRYERLQRELLGVERGEWDQQLQERANARSTGSRSPSLARKSPSHSQKSFPPSPQPVKRDGLVGGFGTGDSQHDRKLAERVEVQRPLDFQDEQRQVQGYAKTTSIVPPSSHAGAQSQMAQDPGNDQSSLPPLSSDQARIEQGLPAPELQVHAKQHEKQGLDAEPLPQELYASPKFANDQVEVEHNSKAAPKKSLRKKKAVTDLQATPSTPQSFPGPILSPLPDQTPLELPPSTLQPPPPHSVGYNGTSQHIHRSPYPPQKSKALHAPSPAIPQHTSGPQSIHAITYDGPPGAHQAPLQSVTQGTQNVPQSGPLSGSPRAPNQAAHPSPTTAPPLSGSQFQPQSYGNGVVQYSPTPQLSPTHQRFSGPQSPGLQTPHQQRSFQPYPEQPPYSPQGQPLAPGGFMLPPFQVSRQDPSRAYQQPLPLHYSQASTPVSMRQAPSSASSIRSGLAVHPFASQARHSFSTPTNLRTPHSATSTPRSAKTLWKSTLSKSSFHEVERPLPLPIDDVETEPARPSQPKNRAPRKSRAKVRAKEKESEKELEKEVEKESEKELEKESERELEKELEKEPEKEPKKDVGKELEPDPVLELAEEPVPEVETRQGRSRRKAPMTAKRRRLGSKASSQAGGSIQTRSRSPSILSHTDTVTADTESQAGYQVKSEPGLVNDVIDEDPQATPSQPSTRRRGAAAQSLKRKRNTREVSLAESEEQPITPRLPSVVGTQTVVAPKGFSRMCNPIMNDIGSHKHSSIFTTAVKAKDAEGYYEIIKRPTDLKSIQKAIAAGAKVVGAAATDTPVDSPGGGGSVIELPMSLDNIPPKAIVNSAQLEKELMRMFVNAVMFNAGEEGIVEDARQMFETVQQSVSKWRSIKQPGGRLEVEETPPVQEDDVPTAAKRRKL